MRKSNLPQFQFLESEVRELEGSGSETKVMAIGAALYIRSCD